ncbi:hypothetical protein HMPREF3215_01894 [Staphylococcus simulans]|nr:hypothetical protein HMPREF3215_01894 [Staphylococcus simulans]
MLNKKFNKFLINSMMMPAIGPKIKVANKAGTSLKSKVKYGGKNGKGNLINIKIKAIALNILMTMKRLLFC